MTTKGIYKIVVFVLIAFGFLFYGSASEVTAQCSGSTSCCTVQDADCICVSGGSEIAGTCGVGSGGSSCGAGNVGTCSCTLWCGGPTFNTACNSSCVGVCPSGSILVSSSCSGGSSEHPPPPPPPPPATLTVQNITINGTLGTASIVPSTTNISGTMTFAVVSDPTVASINPLTDTPGYQTTATGLKIGSTTYSACATDDNYGNTVCDTATITVVNPGPWVQIKGGDVVAGGSSPSGNIISNIPAATCGLVATCDPNLITFNIPGSPGAAVAGGTVTTTSGGTSEIPPYGYTVAGDSYEGPVYDYDFFADRAGSVTFVIIMRG